MNERKLIAEVLKRRPGAERDLEYLPEEIFNATEEIGEAQSNPVAYVVRAIDKLRSDIAGGSSSPMPAGGAAYARMFDYLSEREWERMEVRAEVLAKYATSEPAVQAFRDCFLGGEVLTPEQAREFVVSLANQNLPVRWFDDHGVSPKNHDTDFRTKITDQRGEIIEFAVRPAGIKCRVQRNPLSEEYGGGKAFSVAGDPSGGWRGFTGYVLADSPLGILRDLSDQLTRQYRDWKPSHAARFVLTGEPPEGASPLWAETGSRGEIVMHVAPWISPESVKNAYTMELWFRGWMGERYGGSQAKRRRRLSDKSLKLLRFITARMERIDDPRERREKGRVVAARWDAQYPEWAYRGDTRTMWRDYNRTLRQVAPSASDKESAIQEHLGGAAGGSAATVQHPTRTTANYGNGS